MSGYNEERVGDSVEEHFKQSEFWFFHRETFLSSGNVSAYQSLTDRIYHALPPLSNCVIPSVFAAQLRLPQLLDVQSCRVSKAHMQRRSSSVLSSLENKALCSSCWDAHSSQPQSKEPNRWLKKFPWSRFTNLIEVLENTLQKWMIKN